MGWVSRRTLIRGLGLGSSFLGVHALAGHPPLVEKTSEPPAPAVATWVGVLSSDGSEVCPRQGVVLDGLTRIEFLNSSDLVWAAVDRIGVFMLPRGGRALLVLPTTRVSKVYPGDTLLVKLELL